MRLDLMRNAGGTDHKNLSTGNSNAFKNFMLQLDAVKGTTQFIKSYNEDVKNHR